MTDASPQNTVMTEVLVRHGIYSHNGVFRIAIMDNTLQDIAGDDTFQVTPGEVALVEAPGTTEWVDRMARTRSVLNHRMVAAENSLREQTDHLQRLGEAILEEAERRDWCSEYDAFAEEWDLPTRESDFDVTMTVRVKARDEDAAADIVRENVNLDSYNTEHVISDPEFYASVVY